MRAGTFIVGRGYPLSTIALALISSYVAKSVFSDAGVFEISVLLTLCCCIVLSVFAHFLLFMYAYGTRLFVPTPVARGDNVIQLAFVRTESEGDQVPEAADVPPWEQFAAEQVRAPDWADPERTETAVDLPERDYQGLVAGRDLAAMARRWDTWCAGWPGRAVPLRPTE